MKKILALATSMFLVLGIATASFAAPKTNTKTAPAKTERALKAKTAKPKKHKKHGKTAKVKKAAKAAK